MKKEENTHFIQALSRFTRDVASDGAIRHLADLGYTAKQIQGKLDYPTDLEHIGRVMWQYFLNKGILTYEEPDGRDYREEVRYVKESGAYGRTTFRRVVERVNCPHQEYVRLDFGRQIYHDKNKFEKRLAVLTERDREYILGLPWDLKPVYHVADERMKRIMLALQESEEQ